MEAQYTLYSPTSSYLYNPVPTLPAVQSKFNSFDKSIGNSWLGGSVRAYGGMIRQKQSGYELGNVSVGFRGVATLLKLSTEVVEISGNATNVMNNGVQNRSGSFRVQLLGANVINAAFQNSSTFGYASSTFNLLPGNGISTSIPIGPISVTVRCNAGCGLSRSANWLLPAATASVGLNASASAYAFANASVAYGVPGFNVGVGIKGQVLNQQLTSSVNASASRGLSGDMRYTLQAITLRLYVFARAIWSWTKNLTSWSVGKFTLDLL